MPESVPSVVQFEQAPPGATFGILRQLGPGLIIAASIVGSGELIATTKTGAEAGFSLLWLIIVGCVIKVFVQVEFGRFALSENQTTLQALDSVPGPRLRANWLLWYWLLMFVLGIGQLGGIVGSVGQAMAQTFPITGDWIAQQDRLIEYDRQLLPPCRERHAALLARERGRPQTPEAQAAWDHELARRVTDELGPRPENRAWDDLLWSALITAITAVMLMLGRYGLIQTVSTILVAGFTAVTIFNVVALNWRPEWAVHWSDLREGLSFRLPDPARLAPGATPVATALATFGIIGVGASELIAYPYWCLERGYARFTGPRNAGEAWLDRARGWLRVMRWDAWASLVIYTFATIAFYLQGAAVLFRAGQDPSDDLLIRALIDMYVPVFGPWAALVLLVGAVAVLYSTFFVASAGNARMAADGLRVFGLGARDERRLGWWTVAFSGVFPFLSLAIYAWSRKPVTLVLVGGLSQSIMLPMLAGAAVYFRYWRCDPRLRPGRLWDLFLWLSLAGLLVVGIWGALDAADRMAGLFG